MSKPVLSDLFTCSGRRNRLSYLLYMLANMGIQILVWGLAISFAGDSVRHGQGHGMFHGAEMGGAILIPILVSLALMLSWWIVSAQRCRDFGWTGWAVLIILIPLVGWLFFFVMLFVPGTAGANRYGPDPLAGDGNAGGTPAMP